MRLQISHLKVDSPSRWGASAAALRLIDDARAQGVDVRADQYAYTAGSSSLSIRFPSWALEGGAERVRERLDDTATWTRIKKEMIALSQERGFSDLSWATVASYPSDPSLSGLSMKEVARKLEGSTSAEAQLEAARKLMLGGGASMVYHFMSEDDIERIMKHTQVAVASDSGVLEPGAGVPHPRGNGNTARVLSEYVRERKVIPLEEAVRKMTSLPAHTFRVSRSRRPPRRRLRRPRDLRSGPGPRSGDVCCAARAARRHRPCGRQWRVRGSRWPTDRRAAWRGAASRTGSAERRVKEQLTTKLTKGTKVFDTEDQTHLLERISSISFVSFVCFVVNALGPAVRLESRPQIEHEHPPASGPVERPRHVELGDREAEHVDAGADAGARDPVARAAGERRLDVLRPRDARVEEPEQLDRHRAVVEPAREQPDKRGAHLGVDDEHPAADQPIELRTAAVERERAFARLERIDVVPAHERRVAEEQRRQPRVLAARCRIGRRA